MTTIGVNLPNREYTIYIDKGLLHGCKEQLLPLVRGRRAAVLTDDNVAPLYAAAVLDALHQAGAEPFLITVKHGEGSKSFATAETVCEQLMAHSMTRSDVLIALGGGVIGDLGGFVASIALRGIALIQIPTTLLSQVDSSVGGKTAVNLASGKNLVGTFYQPRLVLIDTDTLDTLPPREIACGMGEIIKYAAIRDAKLAEELADGSFSMQDVIARCCAIKARIVEGDEHDHGERMLLNFGHTLGHAVENYYGYGTLSHGAAVAAGMCMMTDYSERIGTTAPGTAAALRKLVLRYGLPDGCDAGEELLRAAAHDKKSDGDTVAIVQLRAMGDGFYERVPQATLAEIVARRREPCN